MSVKLLCDLTLMWLILGVTALALLGWGNLTWQLLRIAPPKPSNVMTVWLGFCSVLLALESVHLFVQIDWKVSFAVVVVGLIGLRRIRLKLERCAWQKASVWLRERTLYVALALLIVCYWSLRATEIPIMFDSGLYHFASIRWLNEEPLVPGLANLHWRLALNQSYFGFIALLNIAPYWNKGYAAAGLFLLALTTITLFQVTARSPRVWRYVLVVILFVYINQLAGSVANPSPDFAVALLEIVVFLYLYDFIAQQEHDLAHSQWHIAVLVFLVTALVTVKLSGVAFSGASLILVLYCARNSWLLNRPIILKSLGLMSVVMAIHCGRNILLSGAPFFPSTFAGIWGLPWALPISIVEFESALIYSWARVPGILSPAMQHWGELSWIQGWLSQLPRSWQIMFLFAAVCLCLSIFLSIRNSKNQQRSPFYSLYFPILSGFAFWIMTAPDIRFLGSVNVLFFALGCGLLASQIYANLADTNIQHPHRFHSMVWRITPLLGVALIAIIVLRWIVIQPLSLVGWQPPPRIATNISTTAWGLNVNVPADGAQCWDAPLPCASVVYGSLHKVNWVDSGRLLGLVDHRYSLSLR
jgi:hypothetical protein